MARGRPKKKKIHKLTDEERARAIGQLEVGTTTAQVARNFKCHPKAIRELKKKFISTGSVKDRPRSGRPRKTSSREDRRIKFTSLNNRKLTAKAMALKQDSSFTKNRVSVSLIKRRLKAAGLPARVARKKPLLSEANIMRRYEWAKDHLNWTTEDWKKVLFSDESPFTLFQTGGKIYVRRRADEAYLPQCLNPTVKHGGGSINIWSIFSYWGQGPVKRIQGIMDGAMYREILKHYMAPYLKKIKTKHCEEVIFQQDNDPKHRSKKVQNYLSNQKFTVLDWPSQSPDINPIENAWRHLKREIFNREIKAKNLDHLFEIVKEEWEKIPLSFFQNLIESMSDRVKAVYKNKGGHTNY
jgi:transposase